MPHEDARLPRFRRAPESARPVRLTARDIEIIRQVARHRFLTSSHLTRLVGGSAQQVLRRLQLLFHHGYLDRPPAQLSYFHQAGSRHFVYGLGNRGARVLAEVDALPRPALDWVAKDRGVKHLFLEHTLAVADVMVALELACRSHPSIQLVRQDELAARMPLRDPFRWKVTVGSQRLGVIPDSVFALVNEATGDRCLCFLEADRATMPVKRPKLSQTSFRRKLLAYEATWAGGLHRSRFGFGRVRVLTVTTSPERVENLLAVARELPGGQGLFLFTDRASLAASDPLSHRWRTPRPGETATLLS